MWLNTMIAIAHKLMTICVLITNEEFHFVQQESNSCHAKFTQSSGESSFPILVSSNIVS